MPDGANRRLLVAGALVGLVATACGHHAQPQVHLIPAGYVGSVYILYDVRDGAPPRFEDGARVYEIPPGGILRSQMSADYGWRWSGESEFYYVAPDGSRSPIEGRSFSTVHDTPETRADTSIGIMNPQSGTVGMGGPCDVKYSAYYVGTKAQLIDSKAWTDIGDYLRVHPVSCP